MSDKNKELTPEQLEKIAGGGSSSTANSSKQSSSKQQPSSSKPFSGSSTKANH